MHNSLRNFLFRQGRDEDMKRITGQTDIKDGPLRCLGCLAWRASEVSFWPSGCFWHVSLVLEWHLTVSKAPFSDNSIVSGTDYGSASACPKAAKYGTGPPESCTQPSDPNNMPASELESWFTQEMFEDLFPFANLGWGPSNCWPYSYEAFKIASRYFPEFGTSINVTNTVSFLEVSSGQNCCCRCTLQKKTKNETWQRSLRTQSKRLGRTTLLSMSEFQFLNFFPKLEFQFPFWSRSFQLLLPRRILQLVWGRSDQQLPGSQNSWIHPCRWILVCFCRPVLFCFLSNHLLLPLLQRNHQQHSCSLQRMLFRSWSHPNLVQLQLRTVPRLAEDCEHQCGSAERTESCDDQDGSSTRRHGFSLVLHDTSATKTSYARYCDGKLERRSQEQSSWLWWTDLRTNFFDHQ